VTGVRRILVLGLAVVAFATAIGLQVVRDRRYAGETRETERLMYIRTARNAQRAALAFQSVAADIYWIRALQHYGGDRLSPERQHRYELLAPLLDLTTALDPYFTIAYRFGSIFLSEPFPGGPGNPDAAIALLQKGIGVQPTKWQYYHDVAFVYYWHKQDPVTAAEWFRKASEQPRAPNWLGAVAANMLIEGGDRRAARFLWTQIQQSEEPWLQKSATRTLQQLDALDAVDQLQQIVQKFPPAVGAQYSWNALVQRRVLRGIPLDPAGAPFDLNPETGEVTLAKSSPLLPLPRYARPQSPSGQGR
jgi:tetratricopeptide (TPR) repeat protein